VRLKLSKKIVTDSPENGKTLLKKLLQMPSLQKTPAQKRADEIRRIARILETIASMLRRFAAEVED
jgi:hypothetical protein